MDGFTDSDMKQAIDPNDQVSDDEYALKNPHDPTDHEHDF